MFDMLMLLARGKVLYFNKANKSVEYFGSIGFQCPELSNPADFFMSMMSKESIEFEKEDEADGNNISPELIENEYIKLISMFDKSYQSSDLKNISTLVYPECKPLSV
jgi:hypothetical protein